MHRRGFLQSSLALATLAAASPRSFAADGSGRRIGFVDYDLNNYHANVFLRNIREDLKDRGFTVSGATAIQEGPSREWAEENEVPYFDDPAQLNEACDYYMVLAPGNPEVHLELCQWVLPFGKATYVDKTFAPDVATAKKIFALADEHGTPIQTSSALRYTNVQPKLAEFEAEEGPLRHIVTWGGGGTFGEYGVHPLELAVSCMGHEASAMTRRGSDQHIQMLLEFSGNRTAVVNVHLNTRTPFAASLTTDATTRYVPVETGDIFTNNTRANFDLFESGEPDVDRRETMTIMRVLETARQDATREGFVELT